MKKRRSTEIDRFVIGGIHMSAFGQGKGQEIVELVNGLLNDDTAKPLLSMVVETEGKLVGHILFTLARLQPEGQQVSVRILAPRAIQENFKTKASVFSSVSVSGALHFGFAAHRVSGDNPPGYAARKSQQRDHEVHLRGLTPLTPRMQRAAWLQAVRQQDCRKGTRP